MRSAKLTLFLLCAFCLVSALPVWAQQVATGTVAGVVSDPTGAVVNGATVTLTDIATGTPRTVDTNNAGRYLFNNVVPGTYNLSVAKQGFAKTKTQTEVKVGLITTVNLGLKLGAATETVEVTAVGTELQTMNATVGNTVTAASLDALPSLNRDVATFVELQPGVSPDGSVGGTVVDQSTFMLDGGNNTNDMDGSMSVYTTSFAGDPTGGVANQSFALAAGPTGVMPTPQDSVEEFKVNTAGQTADFNSSSGAQVQVVTRRGTNSLHGSVYDYYLDNNFSANSWDNNFNHVPVPDWHRSRFGARAGGPILPKLLGGKTYLFGNYEGYRWPLTETYHRITPSADMRLGLLTFGGTTYNLNPYPVTSAEGVPYAPNAGCTGPCDPLGIGINPLIKQIWQNNMPLPNASCILTRCDGVNIGEFDANLAIPQTSNFGVARLDHDFGDKWHFTSSFRYFRLSVNTDQQVDIGGMLPGDKLGIPASHSLAPQVPWFYVAGLTTNISTNTTNDFRYSYLRNWWAWNRAGDVPQTNTLGTLAGAIEPLGESRLQVLAPYNVNTQQTRTRFWDGHDQMIRDDVSMLRGNHLFQFGGAYQHNFNWHQRTDNGGGINYQPVYQISRSANSGINMKGYLGGLSTSAGRDYAAALGIVSVTQQAYTRTGPNLTLNPPLTPAFDQSTIPYYNVYFSDTWHMKKSFTLTYGLGWTLEMPPVEKNGKQIELVDQANQVIDIQAYLHTRQQQALQGNVYNPIVGWDLVGNTENGRKYPYDPYYGSFSPRIAAAWNPKATEGFMGKLLGDGSTVIRAGYGRIYGRLNGVDLVLVPLLGTGLIQPVQCFDPLSNGVTCAGPGGSTPATAYRIAVNGFAPPIPQATATLPQPLFSGINNIAAGAGEALDPHFRPNVVNSVDFTIQRQLSRKVSMEIGYIGRFINHEYQPLNINTVPYMITKGGQRFDNAYANLVLQYCGGIAGLAGGNCAANAAAVQPQPFFEAALANTGYCLPGPGGCTAAVVQNEGASGTGNLTFANVWSLYSDLDCMIGNGTNPCTSNALKTTIKGGFNFPRSMMNSPINCLTGAEQGCSGQLTSGVGVNASVGYGNYNAGFVSLKMADWRGLTAQSNFTWSKALGTGAVVQSTSEDTAIDPFDLRKQYGLQGFDRKFIYNLFFVYQPPFYKGQQGFLGRVLGGWSFAPIFTAGTGLPITLGTINGGGQAFGEGDSVNFFGNGNSENAILIGPAPNTGVYRHPAGVTCPCFPSLFADPTAAWNNIRQPILGLDSRDGGWGVIRGLPYWNVDMSVKKNFKITERVNAEASIVVANVLNHVVFFDPGPGPGGDYYDTSTDPVTAATLPGQANGGPGVGGPRTMEFGIRVNF